MDLKFLNLKLKSNGETDYNRETLPLVFEGENNSTKVRLLFEDTKFRNDDNYIKTIIISNTLGNFGDEVVNNEYLLKKEHLISPMIDIVIEVAKIEEFGLPQFVSKWKIKGLSVSQASSYVKSIDWEDEYSELLNETTGSTLQDMKNEMLLLREQVNQLYNEDRNNDDAILLLQQEIDRLDNIISIIEGNVNNLVNKDSSIDAQITSLIQNDTQLEQNITTLGETTSNRMDNLEVSINERYIVIRQW